MNSGMQRLQYEDDLAGRVLAQEQSDDRRRRRDAPD